MELDKMKTIWKESQVKPDKPFQKEEVMNTIRRKIHQYKLHDEGLPFQKGLTIALACLAAACLIWLILAGKDTPGYVYALVWVFGMSSGVGYLQYRNYKLSRLNTQSLPLYVESALKRIKAQKITRVLLPLVFAPVYFYIFFWDADYEVFTREGIIAGVIMLTFFGVIFGSIYWFRKKFNTGSIQDLEKELKELKKELKQAMENNEE